ncbi:solute carrier family 35 member F6-like [Saccoglossus kowalevskii]
MAAYLLGNIQDNTDYSEPITIAAPYQPRIFQFIFIIPTICDLFGTTLAGLVLVGLSDIFEEEGNKQASKQFLGIALILGGQLVSASQMIIEETFLKRRGFHPLHVVGMEGIFGVFFLSAIILPILYYIPDNSKYSSKYEDSLDALLQIKNSTSILIFTLLYLSSIAFYNYFGLAVTKSLTAVHRTLIDACRTIVVWVVSLFIYYAFGQEFGEGFDTTWGILQIDGFMFLVIGTALYNELFDLEWVPCCKKPLEDVPVQSQSERRRHDDGDANSDEDAQDSDGLLRNKGNVIT